MCCKSGFTVNRGFDCLQIMYVMLYLMEGNGSGVNRGLLKIGAR